MNSSSRICSILSIICPIGVGGSLAVDMTQTGYSFVPERSVRLQSELRPSFYPPLLVGFPKGYKSLAAINTQLGTR